MDVILRFTGELNPVAVEVVRGRGRLHHAGQLEQRPTRDYCNNRLEAAFWVTLFGAGSLHIVVVFLVPQSGQSDLPSARRHVVIFALGDPLARARHLCSSLVPVDPLCLPAPW